MPTKRQLLIKIRGYDLPDQLLLILIFSYYITLLASFLLMFLVCTRIMLIFVPFHIAIAMRQTSLKRCITAWIKNTYVLFGATFARSFC